MSEHAKFSPSHAATWSNCTASHALEQSVGSQDRSSPAAEEGTYAHAILEKCLLMGGTPYDWLPEQRPDDFPESVKVYDRDEMAEGVQVAVDYVSSRCVNKDVQVLVEQKVTISEDCWGTADIMLKFTDMREVIDFKYGRGILVEVENNAQLELYAVGARATMVTIVQPRIHHPDGPVRSVEYTSRTICDRRDYYKSQLALIALGHVTFEPSTKACQWCRAKGSCKALAAHAAEQMFGDIEMKTDAIEAAAVRDPAALTMEERTAILRNVELCRAWLKAVEAQSLEMALEGEVIDGFKIVIGGNTQRKWNLEEEEMLKKLRNMGLKVADITTSKLKGPAPVEKLARRLKFSARKQGNIQNHIIKPPGGKTLVPESDSRVAVATNAEQMFGDNQE